jgi:purine nucleoside phosphorylase
VQEDRDKVQQAARFALSALGVASGQLKAAVFLEGPLATALTTSVFKPDGPEIAAATVPFLFDDPVDGADLRGARWRITRSGHTLVVYEAHAQGKWSHFRNVYGLGFCTRMLGAMGVHTALFAPTVAACAPGFAVGELVVVSDHINLTGVNALFGHEKWGIRFPDMKDVYTKALRNAAASASAARKLPESIVAHVGGPVIDSSALGRHANSLGATSMTCGFVQQVIRARHMGMHVFALGFVSQDFAKDGAAWHPHAVPDAAALKRAADILAAVAAAAHKLEPTKQEK